MRKMRETTPEQWLKGINSIDKKYQGEVARIVWWDFFAGRLVSERWPHLDEYLLFDKNATQTESPILSELLVQVGYDPEFARRRCDSSTGKRKIKRK